MIDMHCHVDLYPDAHRVVEQVTQRRMYVLAVTTTPRAWEGTCRLVENSPRIKVALGLHPQLVKERASEVDLLCSLIGETRYVGEIGLDGMPDARPSLGLQSEVLHRILEQCEAHDGRILSVHSRGAMGHVLDILKDHPHCGSAVLHWFSGTQQELRRAIAAGCWFSVGPAMLQSQNGLRLVKAMPKERILTETDGPFARKGSQSLMPWDVHDVVEHLAEAWQTTLESADQRVQDNLRSLVVE